MSTINSQDQWPKAFYDTGGGSYGLVPTNKLQPGTIISNIQIGPGGPLLSASTQQIIVQTTSGTPIILGSDGISGIGDVMHLSGTETVTGLKTFANYIEQMDAFGAGAGPTLIRTFTDSSFGIQTLSGIYANIEIFDSSGSSSGVMLRDNSVEGGFAQGGISLGSTAGIKIWTTNPGSNKYARLLTTGLTTHRDYTFPDASGTFVVGSAGGGVAPRVSSITSSATPTANTDNIDTLIITALAVAITSMTTNLSGTPANAQRYHIAITDNGTSRSITWGASFEASTVALPTATTISTRMDIDFIWNAATSKWRCIQVA